MAKIQHYDLGDTWTPQATFTVNGSPTDPTQVTARVKKPDGTITVLGPVSGGTGGGGITRVSAGVFQVPTTFDASGYWFVRIEGTGTAAGAAEHEAVVDPSEFTASAGLSARALVGLAETKDWLQRNNIETGEDLEVVRAINDMSDRFIEESGMREFKPWMTNPSTRTFLIEDLGSRRPFYVDGQWMGDQNANNRRVQVGDLTSFTAVNIIDGTNWSTVVEAITPLTKIEAHPLVRAPWEPIRELEFRGDVASLYAGMRVSVTGVWGFPLVPGNVRQAVLDAVAYTLDRDVESYRTDLGPAAGTQEAGTTIVFGGGSRILSLPPSAQAVAWGYRGISVG